MGGERWVNKVCSQVCVCVCVCVRTRVCVLASMSAGGQAGKSCAECLSLDASWQGVSLPAVASDMCVQ